MQEQVWSTWWTWEPMHKGKDCYDTGAHTGPWATLVEGKTVQRVKDAGTSGDMVLGRMRSFFVFLFCFVFLSFCSMKEEVESLALC